MALSRRPKQFLIIFCYLFLVVLLGTGVYLAYFQVPATCFDTKQNQDETGVDCGGVCQETCKENLQGENLQIQEIVFVADGSGRYDILGKVYNPNDEIGASSFTYQAELRDSTGRIIATRSGTSYILPQEGKYILELNLAAEATPVTAFLSLSEVEWVHFSGYQEKPVINIYQKRYNQIASGAGFGEAYGLLSNESPYDFRSIIVQVILRDANNTPLAFNATEMRTVKSREERDFRLVWPDAFPGVVEHVEMAVDADVYHSDNFVRQYLPGGKFQEFTPPRAF